MSTYTIKLAFAPGQVPEEVRLRQLLKLALRAFSAKCLDVRQIPRQTNAVASGDGRTTQDTSKAEKRASVQATATGDERGQA